MTNDFNRRDFLVALGMGAAALAANPAQISASPLPGAIKPISGSWFEFQHHATVEGVDWNPACARFTAAQWDAKIKEISETGMEYLVLMATAVYYRSFYKTTIYPKWELGCADPLEAVLAAADKYKMKFFIGAGFYGNWESGKVKSGCNRLRNWPTCMATIPASTVGIGRMRRRSIPITRRSLLLM